MVIIQLTCEGIFKGGLLRKDLAKQEQAAGLF